MSEVTVVPSNDNSLGFIAFILIALVLLGIFAFSSGWFSMSTSTPKTSIDVIMPTPTSTDSTSETGSL